MKPIIEINQIEFSYQEEATPALKDISFSINKGEWVAIVGHNGSGKSTLLHILGSVDKPTKGKVSIEGIDISTLNPTQSAIFRRRKKGYLMRTELSGNAEGYAFRFPCYKKLSGGKRSPAAFFGKQCSPAAGEMPCRVPLYSI